MKRIIRQIFSNKRGLKTPNVKFGLFSRIGDNSSFEGDNRVGKLSFVWGAVGHYSYFGDNVVFMGSVGRFTSISSNVHVINGRHPLNAPFVSTSPMFYSIKTPVGHSFVQEHLFDEYLYADEESKFPVKVGSDCWIGFGASIIGGVTIGDGAVILANATVTKDVPPYAIVGGVPAKVLGYRYDDLTIEKLLAFKWWDKDINWIKENSCLFSNINDFIALL